MMQLSGKNREEDVVDTVFKIYIHYCNVWLRGGQYERSYPRRAGGWGSSKPSFVPWKSLHHLGGGGVDPRKKCSGWGLTHHKHPHAHVCWYLYLFSVTVASTEGSSFCSLFVLPSVVSDRICSWAKPMRTIGKNYLYHWLIWRCSKTGSKTISKTVFKLAQ
jgi:hypothetical protein